tara:strand:+ start:2913 stop:3620 length:708 start_codon:yes stop_codon:yes gene_type:complete
LKVKEVSNFYFFLYGGSGGKNGPKYANETTKIFLLVGSANFPMEPSSRPTRRGTWRSQYSAKRDRFLTKNNVYEALIPKYFHPEGWHPGATGKKRRTRTINGKYHPNMGWMIFARIESPSTKSPTPLLIAKKKTGNGSYFFYKTQLYLALSADDILNHLKQEDTQPSGSGRERIPDDTQIFVWNRDGGSCVKCGSRENLAYDHIIPHSLGGSNSRRNLQLLCDSCNLKKSNKIGG